jgi:fermentation-respiration switch protein FrsA (DUF1100 family)
MAATSWSVGVPPYVKFVGIAALGSLVGAVLLAPVQRRLIYLPSNAIPEVELVLPGAEDVTFTTDDGLALDGWFLASAGDSGTATVIVFNGNGGNRGGRAVLARALATEGYGVLLFDYRGYGTNPGTPSESGLLADGRAAVTYVESRVDVDSDRLVYFGESLGAAVAIATARSRAPAALVLRSPFTSLRDAASVHFPFLPTDLLLVDRYPNESIIGDVEVPVLVVAGSADRTVPPDQSQRLFDAAREPKRLFILDGADHNDVDLSSGQQVMHEVVAFIEDSVAQSD